MTHSEINSGMLRAWVDGETKPDNSSELAAHVKTCADCQAEIKALNDHASSVRAGLDNLPQTSRIDSAAAWAALQREIEHSSAKPWIRWSPLRAWSLAGAGAVAAFAILVTTVAPIRGWAEQMLSIFRVEHVTVLDINPDAMRGLENDQIFNQEMTRLISQEVTVTQPPQPPQPVSDAAAAAKQAGFPVHLLAGQTPDLLFVRNTITAQMKLDRDRLQTILAETGRTDLQIPQSVDGAVIGLRIPAGIMAIYGNCEETMKASFKEKGWGARMQGTNQPSSITHPADASCVKLNELPSPTASAPQQIDPAELARVALQFAGLSANEAANFTQTVDWTSTFVLPVLHGQSSYEKVNVNGNEAVLLRPKSAPPASHFNLIWVDNGILYNLMGTGDDTAAANLASQIE